MMTGWVQQFHYWRHWLDAVNTAAFGQNTILTMQGFKDQEVIELRNPECVRSREQQHQAYATGK